MFNCIKDIWAAFDLEGIFSCLDDVADTASGSRRGESVNSRSRSRSDGSPPRYCDEPAVNTENSVVRRGLRVTQSIDGGVLQERRLQRSALRRARTRDGQRLPHSASDHPPPPSPSPSSPRRHPRTGGLGTPLVWPPGPIFFPGGGLTLPTFKGPETSSILGCDVPAWPPTCACRPLQTWVKLGKPRRPDRVAIPL